MFGTLEFVDNLCLEIRIEIKRAYIYIIIGVI